MSIFRRKRKIDTTPVTRQYEETIMTPDGRRATVTTTATAAVDDRGSFRYDINRRVVAEAPNKRATMVPPPPPGMWGPPPRLSPAPPPPPPPPC